MIRWTMAAMVAVSVLGAESARGDTEDEGVSSSLEGTASAESNFHARVGFGLTPVAFRSTDHLPTAHHGIGAFFTAFAELPYRFSVGGGFDWERYGYETTTYGAEADGEVVFPEEQLTHTRLLGLLEWEVLERDLVNPYLLVVTGWGWEQATKTRWQCSPETSAGPVFGGGAGVDIAASSWFAIGLEYRVVTQPLFSGPSCSGADEPDEPMGPPSDFIPQRIALTLSVNETF
jgi:hypothetical protein